jgi:hypothetical protein
MTSNSIAYDFNTTYPIFSNSLPFLQGQQAACLRLLLGPCYSRKLGTNSEVSVSQLAGKRRQEFLGYVKNTTHPGISNAIIVALRWRLPQGACVLSSACLAVLLSKAWRCCTSTVRHDEMQVIRHSKLVIYVSKLVFYRFVPRIHSGP